MATFSNPSEGFYDESSHRSPRTMRNPQLTRHNSRPMDGYNTMQGSMFGNGTNGPNMRFDTMRDNFGPPMQGGNNHFPYDAGAAQTWNASSMQYNNGFNSGMPQGNGYGGPARSVKPSRGRGGLNDVCSVVAYNT